MSENPDVAILQVGSVTLQSRIDSPEVFDWFKNHAFDPLAMVKEGDRISLMANMNSNGEDNGKGKPWFLGKIEGIPVKILRTEDKRKKGWRFRIFVNGDPKPKEAREEEAMKKAKEQVIKMKNKLKMGGYRRRIPFHF